MAATEDNAMTEGCFTRNALMTPENDCRAPSMMAAETRISPSL